MPNPTKDPHTRDGDPLTGRERELLALVAGGVSTADIATQLDITPATIKAHLTRVYKKIGTRNRVQAARYYLDNVRQDPAVEVATRPASTIDRHDAQAAAPRRGARLSRRELQVLERIGAGDTNEAIGRELGLTTGTVKTHMTSIYRKTGSQNRVQAARYYLRHYGTADAARLTNLDDDIADVKARLHELQPAVEEAQRLQQALQALGAARSEFKS